MDTGSPPSEWNSPGSSQLAEAPRPSCLSPTPLSLDDAVAMISSQNMASVQHSGGKAAGVASSLHRTLQPSGPRHYGQGVENAAQGIISAEKRGCGAVVMRVSLLAAGFVIGPSGASVKDIVRKTGADIRSWTEQATLTIPRSHRLFLVQGNEQPVVSALDIICAAVQRYKDLCEGRLQGTFVSKTQMLKGIEFFYSPPPKHVVPHAAGLKPADCRSTAKLVRSLLTICGQLNTDSAPAKVKDAVAPALAEGVPAKARHQSISKHSRNALLQLSALSEEAEDVGSNGGLLPGMSYGKLQRGGGQTAWEEEPAMSRASVPAAQANTAGALTSLSRVPFGPTLAETLCSGGKASSHTGWLASPVIAAAPDHMLLDPAVTWLAGGAASLPPSDPTATAWTRSHAYGAGAATGRSSVLNSSEYLLPSMPEAATSKGFNQPAQQCTNNPPGGSFMAAADWHASLQRSAFGAPLVQVDRR